MQPSDFLPTFGLSSGSPRLRPTSFAEEWTGPPRLLGRPLCARPGHPPRQMCHSLAHLTVMTLLPSEHLVPWAPGKYQFRGRSPAAHTLVDLRIATTVTRNGARPYFRPAGLSSGRVGFTPTGRQTEFLKVSPPPFPSDQPCLVAS